jgi:hypothetical protein
MKLQKPGQVVLVIQLIVGIYMMQSGGSKAYLGEGFSGMD